jgi:O-antigen/teichoic acid export membrane protein
MKLLKINLVRNISTVAASTVTTQAILLAAMPLLSRLYSPVAFGMFATFSALHAMALILFSLKYDLGIIGPRDDDEARNVLALAIFIPSCLSLLLLGGLLFLSHGNAWENWYLLLLPASILAASVYSGFQQWGARQRDYRHYAVSQVLNTAVNLGLCLLVGVVASGQDEGLILGLCAGFLAGAIYMCWIWRSVADVHGKRFPSLQSLWQVAVQHRHMPFQVLPFTILVVIMQSGLPLVLGMHYSLTEVGLYALAARALLAPGAIIGAAIGEPFRAELAARMRQGHRLVSVTRKLMAFLIVSALAVYSSIYAIAPVLFEWLFGENFAQSGGIARALCLGAFSQFIILPLTYTFVIAGHMKAGIQAQAAVAIIPVAVLYVASRDLPIDQALNYWSFAMFSSGVILILLVYRAALSPNYKQI